MDNSILNAEHKSNLHGYKIALDDLVNVLDDPDIMDGVICMDKNHRLMFDIDYLSDKIMDYMDANYKDYCLILADKEAADEN